jgi:hypothetical protein
MTITLFIVINLFLFSDYILEKAIDENNPSLCKWVFTKLGGSLQPHACYKIIAENTLDYSICKTYMKEPFNLVMCYSILASLKNDTTGCYEFQKLVPKYYVNNTYYITGSCISTVASRTNNLSLCDSIPLYVPINTPEACYSNFAQNSKNISVCYEIKNQSIKELCIDKVTLIFHPNP